MWFAPHIGPGLDKLSLPISKITIVPRIAAIVATASATIFFWLLMLSGSGYAMGGDTDPSAVIERRLTVLVDHLRAAPTLARPPSVRCPLRWSGRLQRGRELRMKRRSRFCTGRAFIGYSLAKRAISSSSTSIG